MSAVTISVPEPFRPVKEFRHGLLRWEGVHANQPPNSELVHL